MIAFKGFNKNLACTMGKGTFTYEVGKTYEEQKAQCVRTGFHCVEEPIEVLSWYQNGRYCIVEAMGDIHEDGKDKIACTKMKIVKEITLLELAILQCKWMQEHPEREYSNKVQRKTGYAKAGEVVIVRGKHPKAAGSMGTTIFLVKEEKESKEIKEIGIYTIDGKNYMPGTYYRTDGKKVVR